MKDILSELPKKIKGFLADDEGLRLYELARESSSLGPCLEIGSYCGKSAVYLGLACKQMGNILFSIDHHKGSEEHQPGEEYHDPDLYDPDTESIDSFREFQKTISLAGLNETVVPIVAKSNIVAKFWSTPLSLVFIDGGHSFETAFADYSCWASHIIANGFLVIHDIFPDPSKGGQAPYDIYKLAVSSGLFREHPMVNTLGILRRVGPTSSSLQAF